MLVLVMSQVRATMTRRSRPNCRGALKPAKSHISPVYAKKTNRK